MVDINRAQRIADQIRRELGRILLQEVKDQRIKLLSVTDVQVSRDLGYAKIYYNIVDDQHEKNDVTEALKKASGYMRSRLAEELALRYTPKLRFIYDGSMEHGRHMSQMIDEAIAKHPMMEPAVQEDDACQKDD